MKLLVADDHTLFRDALVQYIERAEPDAKIAVAKDFPGVRDVMAADAVHELILLDLKMPGMNGMEGFRTLRARYPDVPVALMSGAAEARDVREAMDLGAAGYFPKTLPGKALLKAIQLVLTGEKFIPFENDSTAIMSSYYDDRKITGISGADVFSNNAGAVNRTPREREVLTYLARGVSNKEIANALGLQLVTVKLHVRGVCRKLDAKNRTQAALKAKEMGLAS